MSKVLSHDPASGITRFYHWDNSTDEFVIQTRQDTSQIVEANKFALNNTPKRWNDMDRIASIPVSIYFDLKKQGIVDDPKAFKRWLSDPDNRFFRTKEGNL